MNFMDIVMEAKKKEPTKKKPEEEEKDLPDEDSEPEDLTEETSDEEEDNDSPPEEDSEPEDFTEEEPADDDTVESEETEDTTPAEDASDNLPDEDSEPEDLTDDAEPEEDSESNDSLTDVPEEDGEGTGTDPVEEEPTSQDSPREIRLLQEDFSDLHFKTKDFITKLNSLDKSNMILNQVIIQIDKNLNRLKRALWDYIIYDYDKNVYVANLYRYNQFIEVFRTNLEMLKSTKEYIIANQDEGISEHRSKRKN